MLKTWMAGWRWVDLESDRPDFSPVRVLVAWVEFYLEKKERVSSSYYKQLTYVKDNKYIQCVKVFNESVSWNVAVSRRSEGFVEVHLGT